MCLSSICLTQLIRGIHTSTPPPPPSPTRPLPFRLSLFHSRSLLPSFLPVDALSAVGSFKSFLTLFPSRSVISPLQSLFFDFSPHFFCFTSPLASPLCMSIHLLCVFLHSVLCTPPIIPPQSPIPSLSYLVPGGLFSTFSGHELFSRSWIRSETLVLFQKQHTENKFLMKSLAHHTSGSRRISLQNTGGNKTKTKSEVRI